MDKISNEFTTGYQSHNSNLLQHLMNTELKIFKVLIVLRQRLDRLYANWSSSCKFFFTLREKSVNYPVKKS